MKVKDNLSFDLKFNDNVFNAFLKESEEKLKLIHHKKIIENPTLNSMRVNEENLIYHNIINKLKEKINSVVHFPERKKILLNKVDILYDIELFESVTSKWSELLIRLLHELHLEDFKQIFISIESEIEFQKVIINLSEREYKTLLKFSVIHNNNGAKYLIYDFMQQLNLYLNALNKNFANFKQLKQETLHLKKAVETLSSNFSTKHITKDIENGIINFEKSIHEVQDCLEENIMNSSKQLEKIRNTLKLLIAEAKINLLKCLDPDCSSIMKMIEYKTKLNSGWRIPEQKVIAFSKLIKKLGMIKDRASSLDKDNFEIEMIKELESEVQHQKNILGQYRGITFFRPLMYYLGRGKITSLEHVANLELAINEFKSSVVSQSIWRSF